MSNPAATTQLPPWPAATPGDDDYYYYLEPPNLASYDNTENPMAEDWLAPELRAAVAANGPQENNVDPGRLREALQQLLQQHSSFCNRFQLRQFVQAFAQQWGFEVVARHKWKLFCASSRLASSSSSSSRSSANARRKRQDSRVNDNDNDNDDDRNSQQQQQIAQEQIPSDGCHRLNKAVTSHSCPFVIHSRPKFKTGNPLRNPVQITLSSCCLDHSCRPGAQLFQDPPNLASYNNKENPMRENWLTPAMRQAVLDRAPIMGQDVDPATGVVDQTALTRAAIQLFGSDPQQQQQFCNRYQCKQFVQLFAQQWGFRVITSNSMQLHCSNAQRHGDKLGVTRTGRRHTRCACPFQIHMLPKIKKNNLVVHAVRNPVSIGKTILHHDDNCHPSLLHPHDRLIPLALEDKPWPEFLDPPLSYTNNDVDPYQHDWLHPQHRQAIAVHGPIQPGDIDPTTGMAQPDRLHAATQAILSQHSSFCNKYQFQQFIQAFAKQWGFDVTVTATFQLRCSRGGASTKSYYVSQVPLEKRRQRQTKKCHCTWHIKSTPKINLSRERKKRGDTTIGMTRNPVKITSFDLQHSDDCLAKCVVRPPKEQPSTTTKRAATTGLGNAAKKTKTRQTTAPRQQTIDARALSPTIMDAPETMAMASPNHHDHFMHHLHHNNTFNYQEQHCFNDHYQEYNHYHHPHEHHHDLDIHPAPATNIAPMDETTLIMPAMMSRVQMQLQDLERHVFGGVNIISGIGMAQRLDALEEAVLGQVVGRGFSLRQRLDVLLQS